MQDAALVGVVHGTRDEGHQPCRGAGTLQKPGNIVGQTSPLDEPHAEVLPAEVLANLVNRHDMGMVEPGGRLGL